MAKSRIALLVAFFNQYREFANLLQVLQEQAEQPDEFYLGIDDSRQAVPPLYNGDFPWSVVRSPHVYDGRYCRGAVINQAAKLTRADFMVTLDGDCLPHPGLIASYCAVADRVARTWQYTELGRGAKTRVGAASAGDPLKTLYQGHRYFIPELNAQPKGCIRFADFDDLTSRAPNGLRGRAGGKAKVMGANMMLPVELARKVKFPAGRSEDDRWRAALVGAKLPSKVVPMPDASYVLHMGPNSVGQYW